MTNAAVSRADIAIGRLAGLGQLIQEPELLLGPSMAQEALASSRIEGTQASLSDVLSVENDDEILDEDLREVDNYLRAAREGVALLADLPITQRFICSLHETLMREVRGDEKSPGELRRSPVWIGSPNARPETARFIPPHQDHLPETLDDWERFVNAPLDSMSVTVKCALMHYQFETIHPFLDGNGRIGRLLIGFSLIADGILPAPILHISGYFEQHRTEYYERLQAVRERGEVNEWIQFFAEAVTVRANDSAERIRKLVEIRERYRLAARTERSALPGLVDVIFKNPVLTVASVRRALGVSQPTASALLRRAEEYGWLRSLGRAGRGGRERWRADEIWNAVAGSLDED
ncbi:Fic/DOC family N-terminal domain-containing protein [Curtobacterium sp. ME-Dv--P-122a]|nr:Fic/DOC family N-terminal domain-containing protein [Curtobacterium sp. ME-Dv--P-122a]